MKKLLLTCGTLFFMTLGMAQNPGAPQAGQVGPQGGQRLGGGRPMGGGGDFGGGDFGVGAPMGGGMGNANSVRFTPSRTTPEQLAKKQQLQQEAYEKKLKKILSEEQYATYEKVFPALMPKPGQRPGGGQGRPQGGPQGN